MRGKKNTCKALSALKKRADFFVGELDEEILTRLYHLVNQGLLLFLQLVDLFLDGSLHDELEDLDIISLAKPVGAVGRLVLDGRIPPRVEVDDHVGARKVESRAALVFEAMAYQVAREIGARAAALKGRVDAIVMTGGLAYSSRFTDLVASRVAFIAPIHVYPGENELAALAEGALRVLRGEEEPRRYA